MLVGLLLLLAGVGCWIGIAYLLAKNDMQLTFAPTGEIKFIESGESVSKVIVNVPGKTYDFKTDTIQAGDTELHWWTKHWGLVWVSLFYPLKKVHKYDFEYDELQAETDPRTKEVIYTMVHRAYDDGNAVNSLYWRYQYPVLARDIEIQGNFQIKVLVNVTLEVIKPVYLIFALKGNWMPFAVSAVSGFIEAYSKGKSFDEFRMAVADNTTKGSLAEFLTGKLILDGSVRIAEAAFVTFDLSGSSETIRTANTAIEVGELNGKAKAAEAKGVAEATVTTATARAQEIELVGNAEMAILEKRARIVGSNPATAGVLAAEELAEAIKVAKPQTLVLGKGALMSLTGVGTK
jgi:hypothetical protein